MMKRRPNDIDLYISTALKIAIVVFLLWNFSNVNNWLKALFLGLATVIAMFRELNFIEIFHVFRAGSSEQIEKTASLYTPQDITYTAPARDEGVNTKIEI